MARLRLPPIGFWSYTRRDDELARGKLAQLRTLILNELEAQLGEQAPVFKDTVSIPHGARWEQTTRNALHDATFFIPILTPNFLMSEWCCREVRLFLEREQQLATDHPECAGTSRIFPIHYIDSSDADTRDEGVFESLMQLQHLDFMNLRHRGYDEEAVQLKVASFVTSIRNLLRIRVEIPDDPAGAEPVKRKRAPAVKPAPAVSQSSRPGRVPSPASSSPSPPEPLHNPSPATPPNDPEAYDKGLADAPMRRGQNVIMIGLGLGALAVALIAAILWTSSSSPTYSDASSGKYADLVENSAENLTESVSNQVLDNTIAATPGPALVAVSNCDAEIDLYVSWLDGAERVSSGPWQVRAGGQLPITFPEGRALHPAPGEIYYYGFSADDTRLVRGTHRTNFSGLGTRSAATVNLPPDHSGDYFSFRFDCEHVNEFVDFSTNATSM
jgi:hypothetical protein